MVDEGQLHSPPDTTPSTALLSHSCLAAHVTGPVK